MANSNSLISPPSGRGRGWTYQTVSRTILGDLHTPVAAYMRLRDIYPQSALMESSYYHDQGN